MHWLNLTLILVMSAYVVFAHIEDKDAIDLNTQIVRHHRMWLGDSEFFNPWQYRIFSMWILEGIIRVHQSVFPAQPEIVPYLFLHFVQMVLIFYLCLFYFKKLGVKNHLMSLTGLYFLCLSFSNSSFHSDLSFNTYFDVLFYLTGALLILTNQLIWIIPLTILAGLNRETSALIPLMVLAPYPLAPVDRYTKRVSIAITSIVLFAFIFFIIRWSYGYRSSVAIHGLTSLWDYFYYNITFFRLYPHLVGTLGIAPILVVFSLKKLPQILQHWFWLIVPVWLITHSTMALIAETRLFLVPHTLIFVPALLLIIERWYADHFSDSLAKN